ncbi:MAG: DUF3237 domain-containing protein [Mycobacterium sp.]
MTLREVLRLRIDVTEPLVIGDTAFGRRLLVGSTGGSLYGARVNGTVNPGGGDWLLVPSDGWARPDIRHTVTTGDGAVLYLQGTGLIEMNPATQAAIAGGSPTEFEDAYLRVHFTIDTGDPRYTWLTHALFLADGRIQPGPAIEYRISQVD